MLRLEHVSKTYGDKQAVSDLSLEVEAGQIVGFLGPNGAGKTTTIRSIVGLLDFDGNIYIDGHSIKDDALAAKKVMAYIPDNPDLYEFMTGKQYLAFIGKAYGVEARLLQQRVDMLAQEIELDDLASSISSYSHGMKQKLALIAAFSHEPKLILLDEPFVGLDPKASFILKKWMKEHCEKGGAIFFSTHVLEVAQKLCDRLAIIKYGKLERFEKMTNFEALEEVFLGDEHA